MTGSASEWSDLIDPMVPEILGLIIATWRGSASPATDAAEDDITIWLCRELRQNRTARESMFRIDTQFVEIDPAPGQKYGRLDLTFSPPIPRESIYFCLECKRLNVVKDGVKRAHAAEYVMHGMLRFVTGQYSQAVRHGGMLGYVLDGQVADAIENVAANIRSKCSELGMDVNLGTPLVSDSDTGPLESPPMASTKYIITYNASYYDGADRLTHSANHGTNNDNGTSSDIQDDFVSGGSAPTVTQGSPPASSDKLLVSQTVYNARGLVEQSIDPKGQITKFEYDDLGRRIAVIENYVNATVSWNGSRWAASDLNDDADRVTSFIYDGLGNVVKQTAHLPNGTGDSIQTTQYVYGVTKGSSTGQSDIQSNDLLSKVHYPQEGPGGNPGEPGTTDEFTVAYAYNRQGELKFMKDQNLTTHDYTRDGIGRVTVDKATKDASSNLDDTIKAIGTTYDPLGRVEIVRSYTTFNPSDLTANVANAVQFDYTSLWQVDKVWQEHNGNVDDDDGGLGVDSPRVTYAYDTAPPQGGDDIGNRSRITSMSYPNGGVLPYTYGAVPNNSDDRMSRLTRVSAHGTIEYDFIGSDMVAIVDYATPDVQLDRTAKHNGHRAGDHPGQYPGYDRFGRVVRHMWVDGDFAAVGTPPTNTNRPPIVELTHSYDRASNRLTANNENVVYTDWKIRDSQYTYDGLHRLIQADRGKAGSPFTYVPNPASDVYTLSQAWKTSTAGESLDVLGNWRTLITDKDGDGPDNNNTDVKESRTHNQANEITEQNLDSAGDDFDHTFDAAGNLRIQQVGNETTPTDVTYKHDLWNRLVRVTYGSTDRAIYTYNGLNWRISKQADVDLISETDPLDEKRFMFYSANWQLLEERIDNEWPFQPGAVKEGDTSYADDIETHLQYIWGPRYIDELLVRRLDGNKDGSFTNPENGDAIYYHCTDVQFSTVAVLDSTAKVLERVSYDAYGKARHHKNEDLDGDGTVNTPDLNILISGWGSVPNKGDVNRDGAVNSLDNNQLIGAWGTGLASGKLSTIGNTIGWDGYVFNSELDAGGMYTVRFRHYRPELGRWLARDPLGYVQGVNLFGYAKSDPVFWTDPSGLFAQSGTSVTMTKVWTFSGINNWCSEERRFRD
ncbi:MAG: dockerin type I domain-containing protein [Phycisphaerales bacterium]|nr:dockerin type I domain-containing protein [Phycisphaerales bacterium]